MKFTLSWLKDHLDTGASAAEISEKLTAIGLEVEEMSDRGEALRPFTVAKILEAEQHPQADKLRVCKVDTGNGMLQIVCGAPNARAGIKVALAHEGALIPANGMKIKKSAIRGVESCGMLCSERELGIGNDSNGIMELPESAKLGESIVSVLGLDDPLFDINITPNRGDCLSVRGIARDLAAAGLGTLKPLMLEAVESKGASPVQVSIENEQKCPLFFGCAIRGVKNGPSPAWLQQRLKAIGLRPISALVDITNYITFDLGRPLHVYDMAKLTGNIRVRDAKAGETLHALNDKEYTLTAGMTAITDDSGVLGLGGIIGGTTSGCTESTTDVFLEAALFAPITIAQTGRALQIDSDARYRFERGVDPAFVIAGAEMAIKMILNLCGGTASEPTKAGHEPHWQRSIHFHRARVESLGGITLTAQRMDEILEQLGFIFKPGNGDSLELTPPSWRADVEGEADIVEEILRIHGFDAIPAAMLPKSPEISKPILSLKQKRIALARRTLAVQGLSECRSWAFLPQAQAQLFGGGQEALTLLNPISSDLDTMRPSLLPNLISAAKRNQDRGFANLALFEVGSQFFGIAPNEQPLVASGLRTGQNARKNIHKTDRAVDAFDAKEDAQAVLSALGITPEKLQITANAPGWYHPGRSGALTLGGKITLAYFGELHPRLLQSFDTKFPAAAFEIFLENLPEPRGKGGKAKPKLTASDFQASERDFALLADESLAAADLLRAVEGAEKTLIASARVFDIYTGKGVPEGKKSIAISVTLQAADRTLTEAEIDAVAKKVIEAAGKLGAALRG